MNYTSNLFANPMDINKGTPKDANTIYANIEQLKQLQAQQQMAQAQQQMAQAQQQLHASANQTAQQTTKTVFDDIAAEWATISDDERVFIEQSEAYQQANVTYQQQFNMFLLEHLGNDFIKSKYGKAPEQVLLAIKETRNKYKDRVTEDINTIKNQNNYLVSKNDELTKRNEELQTLLTQIKDQVWVK